MIPQPACRKTVQALHSERRPVPGYALAEADPAIGNAVRTVVTWKGRDDVNGLALRTVRLRFVMRDAELYAFQFSAAAARGQEGSHQ